MAQFFKNNRLFRLTWLICAAAGLALVTLVSTGDAAGREVEIVNWGNTPVQVCYKWNKEVTETGAGGSGISNLKMVQGWRVVGPKSSHTISVKGNQLSVCIHIGNQRYLTYKLQKDVHFIHPFSPFDNVVTGGAGNGKDKGRLRRTGMPWIEYGERGVSPDRPLQAGFVRQTFYKLPANVKRLDVNR